MNSPSLLSRHSAIESTDAKSPDVLRIARALWAGKWQIAGIIAVTLVLAAVYSTTAELRYTSRATLSLEGMARQSTSLDGSNYNPPPDEKYFETEAEVLRSRGLVENLVQKLSLVDDPEFNPTLLPPEFPSILWASDRLRSLVGQEAAPQPDADAVLSLTISRALQAISVRPITNTYLIELYAETSSPEKSAEMANTLAGLYIAARRDTGLEENRRGAEWLAARVVELEEALEAAELKVSDFRASTEVTSPEALAAQNEELKALRDRYAHSQTQIALAETRMSLLDDVLNEPTPEAVVAIAADPVLSVAIGASGSEPPSDVADDPEFQRLARIEADRIEAETDRERRLAETRQAAIAELEARVQRQSREIVQLRQLEREANANAAVYEFALSRLKQLSIERGIERAPVRILSTAEPSLGPSNPGFGVVAALAMVFGAFLGVGLILVRQGVHDSFRTPEDIERLSSIPVIGRVLELPTSRPSRVMSYVISNDVNPFSESIRNLRTSILSVAGDGPSVIALTSAIPGEGKTTLTLALARSMSIIGKKVLVIDADLRGGKLKKYLRSREGGAGLVAAITDGKPISDLVIDNEALGAAVLQSETSHSNAADLFSRPAFSRVLAEARRSYDIVILDTPPTLLVPDAKLIAPHADMLLMAVRWGHTTRWQLADAVRELQLADCVVTGFVLSRMDPKGMARHGYGDRSGLSAAYRSGYYGSRMTAPTGVGRVFRKA